MPKINNIMSTTIDINTIKASNSLKSLNTAIRATTNAWKANEARAKSVGDYYKAAESRYEGLGKNIENVKSKIKYLSEQQGKLDRSTQQGQESYNKYANKLAQAEHQLANLTAQQKRAQSSVDYQKKGLAGLQTSYKSLNDLANSRIKRMKAEGHEVEANRTQLNTYRNSITNLTKQQKLQSEELSRIASDTGKSSEAYRKQEIRLNKTSTALANTKNAMNELDSSMHKANPSVFDKIKAKISSLNGETEKTHRTFKEVFMGSALGNSLSNAFSNLGGHIKNAYTEGMNLNLAIAKINGRFKSMGYSNKAIASLDKQMDSLKSQTDMTGDNVANLQSHMLNWSVIGRKNAMQMAKMIAGVGDSSKLTGDQIEQLSAGLMRVGSTGKVTISSLSRITKTAPTFMAQLAKGAHMSQSHLRALLKTGNVTQAQFQKWMAAAGKYSNVAFKGFGSTQAGAIKMMQSRWQKLEQTMTAPIFNAKTSGLQSLKDILTSPELMHGANAIGKGIASIIGYLDKHKKDISGVATDTVHIGVAIGKDTWKDFAGIVGDIGKSFGLVHGNAKKSTDPLHEVKLTMDGLAKNKTAIQWISKAIIAMAAVKTFKPLTGGLLGIAKGGFSAYKNIKALHTGFKGLKDIKDLKGSEKVFAAIGSGAHKAGSAIGKHLGNAWDKALIHISNGKTNIAKDFNAIKTSAQRNFAKIPGLAHKAANSIEKAFAKTKDVTKGLFGKGNRAGKLNGLLQSAHSAGGFKNLTTAGKIGTSAAGVGVAVDTATSIVKAIKAKAGSRKQYEDIGTAAGKGVGGAIGLYFGGPAGAAIGAKIGGAIGKWGGDAAKNFQNGWNKKKPPKKFWSLENLGWSTHHALTQMGKWGNNLNKSLQKGIKKDKKGVSKAWNTATKDVGKFNSSVKKHLNDFGKAVAKDSKKAFDAPGKAAKRGWEYAYKHSSRGTKQIMRGVAGFAKRYVKTNKDYTKATTKNFAFFSKRLKKNHGDLFKTIGQTAKTQFGIEKKRWSSDWSNIRKSTNSIWKGVNKNANDMYKRLNNATHGGLGRTLSRFKNFGSGLKSFWDKLWSGLFHTADKTVKKVQEIAGDISKFFHGKLKVGSLHLAGGTDWRKDFGYPVIVNDAPGENYREGLIDQYGNVTPFPKQRNLKWWLLPGQGVINGQDMANLFGRAIRYANGSVKLNQDQNRVTITSYTGNTDKVGQLVKIAEAHLNLAKKEADKRKKKREEDKKRHADDKKARAKKDRDSKKSKKNMVLVDKSVFSKHPTKLTGHYVQISKNRLDHILDPYKYIAKEQEAKAKKKREKAAKKRKKEREKKKKEREKRKRQREKERKRKKSTRRTTSRTRRSSSSTRSTSRSTRSTSSSSRTSAVVVASVKGSKKVSALSKAIRKLKGKHKVSVSASAKGSKKVGTLRKAINKVKGTHKVRVKTTVVGTKAVKKLDSSIKSLTKRFKSIKSSSRSAQDGLKSLRSHLSSVQSKVSSLYKTLTKDKFGSAIEKQAVKAVDSLKGKGNFSKQFSSMTKKFGKDLDEMEKNSTKKFKSMWASMTKSQKDGTRNILHDQSSFNSKYKHGWNSLDSGVLSAYGKFWKEMRSTAHSGLSNVFRVLNTGITKIDNVVHEFGGNGKAIHTVHFAKGTDANGRLTHNTLAVVNDAKSGPRQEALITDKNEIILPKGHDIPVVLKKGWGVLNGQQTQSLGLPHFANGTGASLHKLYKLAEHYNDKPRQTGKTMFKLSLGNLNGAIKQLASGMKKQGSDQGVRWWSQLWKMVNDKINDGDIDAKGLLKAVEHYGEGHRYVWGGSGPRVFDCSGLVMYALAHKYGIDYPHFSGAQYARTQHISKSQARMGDLVFWGRGGSEHVGVYAGGNRYFSAESPSQGIHMNSLDSVVGKGKPLFGRVKGLKQDDDSEPKVKANNKLEKLIKRQVGKNFWKVINKIAEKYGDADYGGNSVTEGMIEAAARRMHVHLPDGFAKEVIRVAISETGNRNIQQQIHDVNSGGNEAQGPLQFTPKTFKAYAMPGHEDIHKPYDELLAFFNNSDWRHSIGWTTIWGNRKFDWLHSGPQGHRRFAIGGIVSSPQLAMVGEGKAPETIIPWDVSQRSRAYKLMATTLRHFESQDKNEPETKDSLGSDALKKILEAINNLNQTMMMFATQPISLSANMRMDSRAVAQGTYKWIRQMLARSQVRGRSNYSGR